jgi:glycosyltransferase involved in cell wall biosynthesis
VKILWVKSDFLHPTTKGGHIRTLEMLRWLRRWHEIHYVAFHDGKTEESVRRSGEYCHRAYPVPFHMPPRGSVRFFGQALANLFSPLPLHAIRVRSEAMRRQAEDLMARENFDALVCDFLAPSVNLPALDRWVIFQHNVETLIWQRHAERAADPLRRAYFRLQAGRLLRYERDACAAARHVVAVSDADANVMREMFGVHKVTAVATGVDVDYFAPEPVPPSSDLLFLGSMDWSPNIDGVLWFCSEILPRIRRVRPECSLTIAGRDPARPVLDLARRDPLIRVTGTVPDVRPYLWGSRVSIVPLRVGGGTRLKIYESMAACVPVVSTTIGAEGLLVRPGENLHIADAPEEFAARCLDLLGSSAARERMAQTALDIVRRDFSWERVARDFAAILEKQARQRA